MTKMLNATATQTRNGGNLLEATPRNDEPSFGAAADRQQAFNIADEPSPTRLAGGNSSPVKKFDNSPVPDFTKLPSAGKVWEGPLRQPDWVAGPYMPESPDPELKTPGNSETFQPSLLLTQPTLKQQKRS